ncbi:MAG: DUF4105 domain-containing protein [Rhodanobacter sp.]|nr:MAG: DUF4105 domain-containing protein [Rhodanobacter sp.]TAL98600.1 MAG: DUF4105 domain-containing protein [Rhodanobacter sp.]TAM39334.1 MAG: DUF4105 domain-containing protein [Rhodanobacter sp.]TAN23346.1 MAG: DUF4105 domain-containing protein [Rhodanobacter sp.]
MVGRIAMIALGSLLAFCSGAWATLALWYRLPGGKVTRTLGSAAWVALVLALTALALDRHSWLPLGAYAAAYAMLLLWWATIAPSGQRDWRDDVARLSTGTVHGDRVRLDNVRNFDWRSDTDYDIRWENRSYDLAGLVSADAVVSHWGSRAIAHAMISFGFADGRHLVFSVEVRKSREQEYSSIGGFFKQFETILIAADENDIIRVRTNVRGEDDYLYPLRLDPPTLRTLFLSYVHAANRLALKPAFYNTFTSNCTTLVYRMARQIDAGLPWDVRLLLTGYLPEYLYRVGVVDRSVSVDVLRRRGHISDHARAIRPGQDFSQVIRLGLDGASEAMR